MFIAAQLNVLAHTKISLDDTVDTVVDSEIFPSGSDLLLQMDRN